MGILFSGGRGVTRDPKRAAEYFRQACEGGDARGCSKVAPLFELGDGIAPDWEKARNAYLKSCEAGIGGDCYNTARLILRGDGTRAGQPRDAVPWYGRACERGFVSACYELAVLHEKGVGVARDPERAFALYKQACAGGDARGCPKSRER
jgi:TPR repeat protein